MRVHYGVLNRTDVRSQETTIVRRKRVWVLDPLMMMGVGVKWSKNKREKEKCLSQTFFEHHRYILQYAGQVKTGPSHEYINVLKVLLNPRCYGFLHRSFLGGPPRLHPGPLPPFPPLLPFYFLLFPRRLLPRSPC